MTLNKYSNLSAFRKKHVEQISEYIFYKLYKIATYVANWNFNIKLKIVYKYIIIFTW